MGASSTTSRWWYRWRSTASDLPMPATSFESQMRGTGARSSGGYSRCAVSSAGSTGRSRGGASGLVAAARAVDTRSSIVSVAVNLGQILVWLWTWSAERRRRTKRDRSLVPACGRRNCQCEGYHIKDAGE